MVRPLDESQGSSPLQGHGSWLVCEVALTRHGVVGKAQYTFVTLVTWKSDHVCGVRPMRGSNGSCLDVACVISPQCDILLLKVRWMDERYARM